jgi:SanA protein
VRPSAAVVPAATNWRRWLKWVVLAAVLSCLLAVWGAERLVCGAAEGRTFDDIAAVTAREAALVLGCSERLANGDVNLFFRKRIGAAAELYAARKVNYLIVSGDNHVAGYDEPGDMKRALVARGVPAEAIYCDYAGFRTLDSVVRAKAIFGLDRFTVVSQEFHNQRAIFLAAHRGLDAVGFNAPDVTGRHGLRTRVRELFARIKTVLDVWILRTGPRFYGPPVRLGIPQEQQPG